MSQAAPLPEDEPEPEEPARPIDSRLLAESTELGVPYLAYAEMTARERAAARQAHQLRAEAEAYGVPHDAYTEMTVRERGAVKQRHVQKLRSEAKRRGIDPEDFSLASEAEREAARAAHPDRMTPERPLKRRPARAGPRTIDEVAAAHSEAAVEASADEEEEPDQRISTDAPPTDADPRRRQTTTVGEVRLPPDSDDLVGWTQPKNLRDVYARWPVGDGQHFIRVERLEPKVWQTIPVAGYIGEIREPMSEEQLHGLYGGRLFQLQVYGPDSKGRTDPLTGLPVIKTKTETL